MRDTLILVGHSMAGFNMRLFYALNTTRVLGIVLVDAVDTLKWVPRGCDAGILCGFNLMRRLCTVGSRVSLAPTGLQRWGPFAGTHIHTHPPHPHVHAEAGQLAVAMGASCTWL